MAENTSVMTKKSTSVTDLVMIGVMAALICIAGPLSIPLPFTPVPISVTNLAIYIALFVLGWKRGTASCLIYLLLGFIGLPVFSSGRGGAAILLGPTGGYLIGFLFMAVIAGWIMEHGKCKVVPAVLGMVAGLAITYLFGTIWFCIQSETGFIAALGMCVIPFLPGDAIKIVIAAVLGPILRKYLAKAGVLI
ncbi:MAG: biotin transporter BioY [Lachnospiraceae bacterium]|nr:biotin transporter BioY [Lachnospiraceae bacterium]